MAKLFNCINCNTEIITKFLKAGEEAKCKECGKTTKVPDDAKDISNSDIKSQKSPSSVNTPEKTSNKEGKSTNDNKVIEGQFIGINDDGSLLLIKDNQKLSIYSGQIQV